MPSAVSTLDVEFIISGRSRASLLLLTSAIYFLTVFSSTANSEPIAEQWIEFKSAPVGKPNTDLIQGILLKPSGDGPFPAIIIAHGCFGVEDNHLEWAGRLISWGYVAFLVDSFTTRDVGSVCEKPKKVTPRTRANDVYGAAAFLRGKSFVDPKNIGMIGFSHGGWAALFVSQEYFPEKVNEPPLGAVVAFYPWCDKRNLKQTNVPLLILAGNTDKWTPIDRCHKMINAQKSNFADNITIFGYENAYHSFDDPNYKEATSYDGYTIKFNPSAAQDSITRTKEFFDVNLSN